MFVSPISEVGNKERATVIIMSLEFATRCIYCNKEKFEKDLTGAISFPIYQSATFAHHEL